MAVRDSGAAALAAWCSPPQPGHLGRSTGLVDEDQMLWIEVRLGCEPGSATGADVGPFLLGCVRCFF